jgi:hypothetical protein
MAGRRVTGTVVICMPWGAHFMVPVRGILGDVEFDPATGEIL